MANLQEEAKFLPVRCATRVSGHLLGYGFIVKAKNALHLQSQLLHSRSFYCEHDILPLEKGQVYFFSALTALRRVNPLIFNTLEVETSLLAELPVSKALILQPQHFYLGYHANSVGLVFCSKQQLMSVLESSDFFQNSISPQTIIPNVILNQEVLFLSVKDLVSVLFTNPDYNPFVKVARDQIIIYGSPTTQQAPQAAPHPAPHPAPQPNLLTQLQQQRQKSVPITRQTIYPRSFVHSNSYAPGVTANNINLAAATLSHTRFLHPSKSQQAAPQGLQETQRQANPPFVLPPPIMKKPIAKQSQQPVTSSTKEAQPVPTAVDFLTQFRNSSTVGLNIFNHDTYVFKSTNNSAQTKNRSASTSSVMVAPPHTPVEAKLQEHNNSSFQIVHEGVTTDISTPGPTKSEADISTSVSQSSARMSEKPHETNLLSKGFIPWKTVINNDVFIAMHEAYTGDFSLITAKINQLLSRQQSPLVLQVQVEQRYEELSRQGQIELRLKDKTIQNIIHRMKMANSGGGIGSAGANKGASNLSNDADTKSKSPPRRIESKSRDSKSAVTGAAASTSDDFVLPEKTNAKSSGIKVKAELNPEQALNKTVRETFTQAKKLLLYFNRETEERENDPEFGKLKKTFILKLKKRGWSVDAPFWESKTKWWRCEIAYLAPYASKDESELAFGLDYFFDIEHLLQWLITTNMQALQERVTNYDKKLFCEFCNKFPNYDDSSKWNLQLRISDLVIRHGVDAFNKHYFQEMLVDDGWKAFEVGSSNRTLYFIPPDHVSKGVTMKNYLQHEKGMAYLSRKEAILYLKRAYGLLPQEESAPTCIAAPAVSAPPPPVLSSFTSAGAAITPAKWAESMMEINPRSTTSHQSSSSIVGKKRSSPLLDHNQNSRRNGYQAATKKARQQESEKDMIDLVDDHVENTAMDTVADNEHTEPDCFDSTLQETQVMTELPADHEVAKQRATIQPTLLLANKPNKQPTPNGKK